MKNGFSRKNSTLPRHFIDEEMPEGEGKGQTVDYEFMFDEFYNVMGWDENGIPKKEKLKELGLIDLLQQL